MLVRDEVVVGPGLAALAYAYSNNKLLLRTQDPGPPPFDFFEPTCDLSPFLFQPTSYELRTGEGTKVVGTPKRDLWECLSFMMSVGGNLPFVKGVNSIRIDPESRVISVVGDGIFFELGYKKLRVFDGAVLHGLEQDTYLPSESLTQKFKILDWFDVRSGCRHEYDHLSTEDDLVKEVYFYPSARVDGKHNLKDLVAVSYLTREQLNDIEYSDTYARLKTLALMKHYGIRGTRNGRDSKNPEKYKYYAVRIEASTREAFPIGAARYKEDGNVIVDTRTVEEVVLSANTRQSYTHKFHEKLVNK